MKETHYILQFIWHDPTSKFDIIGPYYTSYQGFDSKFTMSCLQDALYHFEAYRFHVLAIVGDGVSWNHTLLKHLCGHSGKFTSVTDDDEDIGCQVSASFINPYSGAKIWFILCPSHEVS